MEVGVLAIQGDFAEHIAVLGKLGVKAQEVRLPAQLASVDAIIIPGGESTTLSRLMTLYNLREPLEQMAAEGRAIWGTCAGMIMLSREITEQDPIPLGIMDIGVQRNAFGRQVDSFEQDLDVSVLGPDPFHAIFIRAPVIIRVGDGVEILSTLDANRPVAVQQGNLLATSFHPELTNDYRFHSYFLELAGGDGKSCGFRNGSR